MEENKSRIKILIILNTLGIGGAEMRIARTAPFFDSKKYDVHIAYYSRTQIGYPEHLLHNNGVKVTFLDRNKWGRIKYLFKAVRFMKENQFDIVHAWTGTANVYGRLPAIIAGVPCILGGLAGRRTANDYRGLAYSLTNWRCSGWVVNSQDIKKIAGKKIFFIEKTSIYVVPNGIGAAQTIFPQESYAFYKNLKSDRPVVGTVGRLTAVKNHMFFLKIAKALLLKGIKVDFWIIGDGPLKKNLYAFIKKYSLSDHVKLLGFRTDIDLALSNMNVFMLTSDSEGCPNVLLEAMRASVPIVSTNCGSLQNIVEEGKNGFLIPPGDSGAMAEKIEWLLKHPNQASEMGKNGKKIVEERFSMKTAVEQLTKVYIECLKKNMVKYPLLKKKLIDLALI